MSTNLNQYEDQLILYWVHLPEHTEEHLQGYIGVTKDFERRMNDHRKKAPNKYFQNAIKKYGWENLVKEVIVRGPEKDILELEQMFRPKERIGWNLAIGGGKPPVAPPEVKSKLNKAWIAENPEAAAERQRKATEAKQTDEARKANSERNKAWIAENPEAAAERERKRLEACRTDEYRKAVSKRKKAWISENPEAHAEVQRKAAEAKQTDEYRKAVSKRKKAWIAENPEDYAEQQRKATEAKQTDEYRKLKSDIAKALPKKTCEHCRGLFTPGNYACWHGDKCKHNPNKDTQL